MLESTHKVVMAATIRKTISILNMRIKTKTRWKQLEELAENGEKIDGLFHPH
jgi:hypothetical protein